MAKPNSLVVDIQTAFRPGMVYVMLSHVCSLQQLFILEKLEPNKIKVSSLVLKENIRMMEVSVNSNPTSWRDPAVLGTRVSSLNVRSLRKHIKDVRLDHVLQNSDIICLQETWLERGEESQLGEPFELEGYMSHFNSQGRGKGIVVYVKEGKPVHFQKLTTPKLQMTKLSADTLDIITIYRSQEESFISMESHLEALMDLKKNTLIVGDFNFCYLKKKNSLRNYLEGLGFRQLVSSATHIGRGLLDQAHFRQVQGMKTAKVEQMSNYYSDHDTITVLIH